MKLQRDLASYFRKKKVLPEPQYDREHLSSDSENDREQQDSDRESSDNSQQLKLPLRQQSKPSTVVLRS